MHAPPPPTAEGLALIKRFEGFRAEPRALPEGGFVIGFGRFCPEAPPERMSEEQATQALLADLAPIAALVDESVLVAIAPNQRDALISLAFSIGADAFRASDALARLNAGEPIAAADAFDVWRRSAISGEPMPLDALVRRRAAEKALFLAEAAPAFAPSCLVKPLADSAVALVTAPGPRARLPDLDEAMVDALGERLREILARAPATARALYPPAANDDEPDDDLDLTPRLAPGEPSPQAPEPGEWIAIAGLAALGVGLLTMTALSAEGQTPSGAAGIVAAPGALALLMAGYYGLKRLIRRRV